MNFGNCFLLGKDFYKGKKENIFRFQYYLYDTIIGKNRVVRSHALRGFPQSDYQDLHLYIYCNIITILKTWHSTLYHLSLSVQFVDNDKASFYRKNRKKKYS